MGVNIAGFDFGCNTDGNCNASGAWPPLTQYYGHDGAGQMQHFVNDDGFNVFRLPVGWQFLINNDTTPSGTLDADNLVEYDALVQACLATGASCIVDVHNYARFDGEVRQTIYHSFHESSDLLRLHRLLVKVVRRTRSSRSSGATSLRSMPTRKRSSLECKPNATCSVDAEVLILAYRMNEPHDIPDINLWAESVQAAVTAIRNAGYAALPVTHIGMYKAEHFIP